MHPPQSHRKDERAKQAKSTVNKTIPALLKSDWRARKGVEAAELIVDPPPLAGCAQRGPNTDLEKDGIEINIVAVDTVTAALRLCNSENTTRSKKEAVVGILNMASPLRPGGGFLNGATSQEEFLCMRTTLYPSLQESFYRLPEIGGVWTPDVLVFRDGKREANELAKTQRRHVGVVSAAMLRFPELHGDGKYYALQQDYDMAERKMRAVMRIFTSKNVSRIVLGAWGCGAYGNPVAQIASLWKKVLLGDTVCETTGMKASANKGYEIWSGVKKVTFAVTDRGIAEEYTKCFGIELESEAEAEGTGSADIEEIYTDDRSTHELQSRIEELEAQIAQARTTILRSGLEDILATLRHQLNDLGKEKATGSEYSCEPAANEGEVGG